MSGFIFWTIHKKVDAKTGKSKLLPPIQDLKPKLILHAVSTDTDLTEEVDMHADDSKERNPKNYDGRYHKAAYQQISCARAMIRFTGDQPMIQVGSRTYCYDSMMLTKEEWSFYDAMHRLSPSGLIAKVMDRRYTIDRDRPWKSLDCPDRSLFGPENNLASQVR
jgi:hypothetical protein